MKEHQHRILVGITASWLVLNPFVRAKFLAMATVRPFSTVFPQYLPEIAIGFVFLGFAPALWKRRPWASAATLTTAIALPIIGLAVTRTWLWIISTVLLLVLSFSTRRVRPKSVHETTRGYMRCLMVITNTPLVIATPAAYLQLCAAATGAVAALEEKRWLAVLVFGLSLLGLYALWTVWSISKRVWEHGRYVPPASGSRSRDICGVVGGWAAMLGFHAIGSQLFYEEQIFALSVVLAPALILTTIAVLTNRSDQSDFEQHAPQTGDSRSNLIVAFAGIVCGVTVALLGIAYAMPESAGGWSPCDWSVLFPIQAPLWLAERVIVYDACNTGPFYQTFALGTASAIFWVAGATTHLIARRRLHLATVATALAAAIALTWVTMPYMYLEHIYWTETLGLGCALVLWAARLGYLGGLQALRMLVPNASVQIGEARTSS